MGEVSQMKALVTRPRPLGLVKKESVRFDHITECTPSLSEHDTREKGEGLFVARSRHDVQLRQDFKSMRDLQETLRQAALLNIVAAVNHDHKAEDRENRSVAGHTVGIKGATLLKHSHAPTGNRLNFEKDASEIGRLSLEIPSTAPTMSVFLSSTATPNTALSQLLSQRSRTISIPRPRTHGEQGSFMHQSLSDAKDQLTNMTNFRARPKQDASRAGPTDAHLSQVATSSTSQHGRRAGSHDNQADSQTPSQQNLVSSREDSLAGFNSAMRESTQLAQRKKAERYEGFSELSIHQDAPGINFNTTATPRLSKEDQRAQTVHQMQAVKRHISTSQKREIVKKLTEMAKCEAVDMTEPIEAPPMVIVANRKDFSRYDIEQVCPRSPSADQFLLDHPSTMPVPSNTRAQSETLEAIAHYRQLKKVGYVNVREELTDSVSSAEYQDRNSNQLQDNQIDNELMSDVWPPNQFFAEAVVGKTVYTKTPQDALELRPVDTSPTQVNRPLVTDKKKTTATRRSYNASHRDRLTSPFPAVFEACYHRPKTTTRQIALVGQSLPSLSITKVISQAPKSGQTKCQPETTRSSLQINKAGDQIQWQDKIEKRQMSLKPWGSTSKPMSTASPILKTEILDHLQCVGIVDQRPCLPTHRKSTVKVSAIAKMQETNMEPDEDCADEDLDKCSETSKSMKLEYRKSKLYSAFRASEENLANLAEVSSLVSEALTTRSLLNQPPPSIPEKNTLKVSECDPPVVAREPLYMGCSSKVSDNEIRSQFHLINPQQETDNKTGSFRVFKALDQDVYFDFQHRKYRNSNKGVLNTGSNKPRLHYLKIQYSGPDKS